MNTIVSILKKQFTELDFTERTVTYASCVTLSRIFLTPIIVILLLTNYINIAGLLFILAASTDFIDGFIARQFDQKTFLGACLDPIADKILLLSVFCAVWMLNNSFFYVPTWFILFLLVKETVQIVGVIILFSYRGCIAIGAHLVSKFTTVVQTFFIIYLFYCSYANSFYNARIYNCLLACMSLLMGLTLALYSFIWIQRLTKGNAHE